MPENKPKKSVLDEFLNDPDVKEIAQDINPESIQNMLNAGNILVTLKIQPNVVYTVKVNGKPSMFESTYGATMSLPVIYDNMSWSLIVPKSFKIQLIVQMIKKNLSFDTLVGKRLNVVKSKGDTKEYKNAMLYRCEILD